MAYNYLLFGLYFSMIIIMEIRYTECAKINKFFIYNERFYSQWSEWSLCSKECHRFRQKVCIRHNRMTCPAMVIKAIESCRCCGCSNSLVNINTLEVLPKKCGYSISDKTVQQKIIGGQPAELNKWPWKVNLGVIKRNEIYINCGATLISKQWVMTAAHCMQPYISNDYKLDVLTKVESKSRIIEIGRHYKSKKESETIVAYISHIIVHPLYYSDETVTVYDFALVRLENPIKSGSISFPCISNDRNFLLNKNSLCYAVGWLSHQTNDDRLHDVKLPLISYETCQLEYMNIYINYSIHICAGENKKDTCEGDSGGGLYCLLPTTNKWIFYGVISFGNDLGCGNTIGVYARISAVVDWISEVITKYSKL